MVAGIIKKIMREKGIGFIVAKQGRDVFFHFSAVAEVQFEDLVEGQKVEFEADATASPKGPRAKVVRPQSFGAAA